MNELTITTNTINELSNGALRKECRNYLNAINGISKSRWKCARAISNVINGEYFADDFKSKREFYTFIGIKESNGAQLVAAQALNDEYDLNDALSVGKCYAISTLDGDAKEFIDTYTLDELMSMSDKAVVTAVQDWKAQNAAADTDDTDEQDTDADVVDEQDTDAENDAPVEDHDAERGYHEIESIMTEYGITAEMLIEYLKAR